MRWLEVVVFDADELASVALSNPPAELDLHAIAA
jgi:hypothetical protein